MAARKAFPLRLSEDLYEDLRRWAEQEFRSVNGQIEYLLHEAVRARFKRSVGAESRDPDDSVRDRGS